MIVLRFGAIQSQCFNFTDYVAFFVFKLKGITCLWETDFILFLLRVNKKYLSLETQAKKQHANRLRLFF